MCHPIWLCSRKYGTVWYHPASSKLWYLTTLSFVNFQEKLTGTSRDSLRVRSQLVRLAVRLALGARFASTLIQPPETEKPSVSCLILYIKLKINYKCICVYHCLTVHTRKENVTLYSYNLYTHTPKEHTNRRSGSSRHTTTSLFLSLSAEQNRAP
jgi:hypothetical protein